MIHNSIAIVIGPARLANATGSLHSRRVLGAGNAARPFACGTARNCDRG